MDPNPIPSNEFERIQRLHTYDLYSMGRDPSLDVFAQAACLITDCSSSLIAMMEENTQFIQSCIGLDLESVPRQNTVCQYTIMGSEVVVIEDTFEDPRSSSNAIIRAGGIRFYAGVPLMDEEGYVLGTICVVDFEPKTLTEKQISLFKQLGEAVSKLLLGRSRKKQSLYFEEIFDVSNNLICVLNEEFKIKKVNPSFEELLQVQSSEVVDKPLAAVLRDPEAADKLVADNGNSTLTLQTITDNTDGSDIIIEWYFRLNPSNKEIFAFGRNITVEIEEKTKLESSERRFRNFFENAIGLMSMHDLKGNVLSVNTKGCENLKFNKEDITSLTLKDILVDVTEEDIANYLKRIETKKEDSGMMVLRAKDGEISYWLYHNILDVDSDGEAYVVSTALNMTDRINLERDLRRVQNTLEQSNIVAQIGAWEMDLETNIVTWSDSAKLIHGVDHTYKPDFTRAINFYTQESQEKLLSAYTKAVEEGVSYDLQLQLVKGKNELIWVRVKGVPEFENKKCKRVYGIIQDIDRSKKVYLELENKEAMLRAFVSHVPTSVAMFDRDFNCVSVSNQWINDFHQHNKENIIGENLHKLFPEIPTERKRIYLEALQGKIYKNRDEIILSNQYDEPQHYDWEVRPWYLRDDMIGGIIIQIENITDTVKANEELRNAKRLADIANRTKSEFLANMSHEIRTPLNGVIGFSDLLMKTPLSEVQLQYLHYINESGNTLLNIINDILDFSKIESGKLELFVDKHDVYEMVNQVINVILYQAQRKGIELLLNIEQGLPNFVWLDEIRVKQILVNLLGNAVKFTEKGEIELKVEQRSIDKDKMVLRFSVRDTGIGIPKDKQQRIFDAFTQEDSSVSKKYGGTGLGLTISNNLLRYMGSNLVLESELHKGSTFYFDLEVAFEYTEEDNDTEIAQIKRVLIVDDNSANRTIMEHMLSFKGIECVLASSGLEALQMLMNGDRFDTILMDYHMPILSGLETIEKIKELFNNEGELVPLIVLHTSSEEHDVINKFRQEERSFCLMKPIKSNELYDMMKRVVLQNKEDQSKIQSQLVVNEKEFLYGQALKVLLADDNPVNMALNVHIMSTIMPNATLTQAVNGLEALNACLKESFDLILMDVQMPVMDGIEATRKIRELAGYAETPIIGVTAGNVVGEKEKCLINGMSGFLAKPIRQKDLEDAIAIHLKGGEEVQTINQEDYLNLAALNEQVGGDETFRAYFLELVLSELKQTAAILNEEANIMNFSGMKASLHKLRGTASTSGLFKLTESCLTLESILKDRNPSAEEVKEYMFTINTEIEIGINLINRLTK